MSWDWRTVHNKSEPVLEANALDADTGGCEIMSGSKEKWINRCAA